MEYEIIEPVNPGSWEDERHHRVAWPRRAVDRDDMRLRAMDIPESEEA